LSAGAAKLLDQITENEQERLFELERKDQENVHMQRAVEKMMDEDRVMLEKRKIEQETLRVGDSKTGIGYMLHKLLWAFKTLLYYYIISAAFIYLPFYLLLHKH